MAMYFIRMFDKGYLEMLLQGDVGVGNEKYFYACYG